MTLISQRFLQLHQPSSRLDCDVTHQPSSIAESFALRQCHWRAGGQMKARYLIAIAEKAWSRMLALFSNSLT
jgi:hypothetical protein